MLASGPLAAAAISAAFLAPLHHTATIAATAPASGPARGDVNPYGVAVVPRTVGALTRGDVLVSNFNDAANQQGTGSSIVEISPSGVRRVFSVIAPPTATRAVGLTTALVALRSGFVVVGSLPAPGGTAANATAGALTILNSDGRAVATIKGGEIDGPWDMTARDLGTTATLFVTNVLNGTVAATGKVVRRGTVVRIGLALGTSQPRVTSERVIASGFGERTDPNALVIGPTGIGLGAGGTLYVADSLANRIAAVPDALSRPGAIGGGGLTVARGGPLNDPLGLAVARNGDIVSANGGDGRVVETSPRGATVAVRGLVPNGAGDLFGVAVAPGGRGLYFVNDIGSGPAANSLDLLH